MKGSNFSAARWLCVALLGALPSVAGAKEDDFAEGPAELVGKPAPDLAFSAYGSKLAVNLADLHGKMVVVDFFKAEEAKDFTAFDDVLDAEHQWSSKGVVVVGVSMDDNQSALVGLFAKKPNIDWPIDYDAQGFFGQTSLRWHASKQTSASQFISFWHIDYLVSPDGTVLWAGEPAELGRAIEDQIKDHKPKLVGDAILSDGKDALSKLQSAISDKNLSEAYKQRARIPADALADEDFAGQVKTADDQLQAAADAALADADSLIENKDYATAVAKLRDLSSAADGTPLATKAKVKLAELQKNPDARAALAAAERNQHADQALKVAQKLQDNKRDVAAYGRYQFVVKMFAGTPASKTAADAVAAYDADPDFKKKQQAAQSGVTASGAAPSTTPPDANAAGSAAPAKPDAARAKSLLSLANTYRDSGNTDKAREKYQAVIDQFPGTPEADNAKDELSKLGN